MPYVETPGFQPISAKLPGSGHGGDRAVQRALRDSVANALGAESKGRGLHGLALAIREKLASAEPGKDAVTPVLETIDRALDDVAAKLAAQGLSRREIDAGIARFKRKLAHEVGELAGGASPATANAGVAAATGKQAIAARDEVRQRFSLDILTAEGDQVSIRFRTQVLTDVAAATVSHAAASATAAQASVISRGRFTVEVDGDLNEAERAAIGKLLDKVDAIAADFFGGDVQAAFAAAARTGLDSDALAAFDLRLSYSRSSAVRTYESTAKLVGEPEKLPAEKLAPGGAAPVAAAPAAPKPAAASVAAGPPVVAQPVQSQPVVLQPAGKDPVTEVNEGLATSVATAHQTARTVSAIETITTFAKDVLERLDEDDESDAVKFSLRWKVEFLVKSFGSVALTLAEQRAADALGIALDGPHPGS